MSVLRDRAEVVGARSNDAFWTLNGHQPRHEARPQLWALLRLTARGRDHRNDRHADGAAGHSRDSRDGHHAAASCPQFGPCTCGQVT